MAQKLRHIEWNMDIFKIKPRDWTREEENIEGLTISYGMFDGCSTSNVGPFTKRLMALMNEVMRRTENKNEIK